MQRNIPSRAQPARAKLTYEGCKAQSEGVWVKPVQRVQALVLTAVARKLQRNIAPNMLPGVHTYSLERFVTPTTPLTPLLVDRLSTETDQGLNHKGSTIKKARRLGPNGRHWAGKPLAGLLHQQAVVRVRVTC